MPLILNFTADDGTEYEASYWRIIPLNTNEGTKTGSFQLHGWKDLAAFEAGMRNIADSPKEFSITDPADYDIYLGQVIRLTTLEEYATAFGGFFALAEQFSYVRVSSADIGSFDSSRVYVRFTNDLGNHLTAGVTIKVNGIAATISSADFDSSQTVIRYDLASPVGPTDVITFEYDSSSGFLTDPGGLSILSVSPVAVDNQVGSYMKFDNADNSGLLAAVA